MSTKALLIIGGIVLGSGAIPMLLRYGRWYAPDYLVLLFIIFPLLVIGASLLLFAGFKVLLVRFGISEMTATYATGAVAVSQYFFIVRQMEATAAGEFVSAIVAWCGVAFVIASVVISVLPLVRGSRRL